MQKTILSGITATSGELHLGNYLGALKPWVDMVGEEQNAEFFFFVADMHAFTIPFEYKTLADNTRKITAAYIAAGIDLDKSTLYAQSSVPQHASLHWHLSSIAQMGWLKRMTQFKDKAGKKQEAASLALFSYPVLQAADVLLYHATHVPVGEDQKQHIELARDVAGGFNHIYGDVLTLPEPIIRKEGARIMSLRDGSSKMSKSAESDMSKINLTDTADVIAQKFRKAKSDSEAVPSSESEWEGRPEAKNLLTIYAVLLDTPMETVFNEFGGKLFSDLKSALADLAVEKLAPITAELNRLMKDPDEIDKVLMKGAEKARSKATKTLGEVEKAMGFIQL